MPEGSYGENFGEKFQQHILAVASRHPGFILRYRSVLSHEYFVSDLHRLVAKALLAHVDEHRQIPTMPTLIEEVRPLTDEDTLDSACRLLEKLYSEDISDSKAVIQKVIEFGKTQAMCNAVIEGAEKIEKGKRNQVMDLIREATLVGEDLLSLGTDYGTTVEQRAQWYLHPEELAECIPTGITHLDRAMGGGLGRRELGVIVAPPKKGKSTTLFNIGFGALINPQKLNVVHYTLEMREKNVIKRYDDRLAGALVKIKKTDPLAYTEELKARVKKFIKGRLFVKEYNTRSVTVSGIRSHLSLLAAQDFHPDLIIVDYADIMKPERRMGEMRHEQAGIYEDLRALAGEYDAALWTGSQAKVGALEKEIITIADFAESFEKAAIVDAAVAFCQTKDEDVARTCRLFMAALRKDQGGTTVECSIARDRCLIKSIQLLDASNTPIVTDDEESPSVTKTVARVHAASTGSVTDKLKQESGIAKPPQKKGKFPVRKGKNEMLTKKVPAA